MAATPTSVDAYIAAQPEATRAALERVRAILRKALPRATEGISYQIPIYRIDGAMVLFFAGFPRHTSIYPVTPAVMAAMGDELAGHAHGKGTLRFPLDKAVPARLITRFAKLRAAEAAAEAKAKSKPKLKPAKTKPTKRRA